MGATKAMVLQMRAEDMAVMYDSTFTKKEAIATGKRLVADVLESGTSPRKSSIMIKF